MTRASSGGRAMSPLPLPGVVAAVAWGASAPKLDAVEP